MRSAANWEAAKVAATWLHVLATCAWLGGLVALAAVLIPGEQVHELDQLIPRFSRVAQLSVVTLLVTGIVHALAVAGGVSQLADSRYGLVLLIKVSIFGLMLLMGNEGRKYAARAAFRQLHQPADASRENSWHPSSRRGHGSRTLHRVRDLVDHLPVGDGRSSTLNVALELQSKHARLPAPQVGAGYGNPSGSAGRDGPRSSAVDPPADPRAAMRRIAAEAVILQDEAEAVVRGARAREGLGFLAPRGGPLVRRFFGLRDSLPKHRRRPRRRAACAANLTRFCITTRLAVWVALDLLACEWRSEKIGQQLDALDGLGAPAVQLDELYAELAQRAAGRQNGDPSVSRLKPRGFNAAQAVARQDRGTPLRPCLRSRCSARYGRPPAPRRSARIWVSAAITRRRHSPHLLVPAQCDYEWSGRRTAWEAHRSLPTCGW